MAPWQNFSTGILAGLHEDENPEHLADNELTEATNCAFWDQMIGTRPGTTR